jgi:hypothetical protein
MRNRSLPAILAVLFTLVVSLAGTLQAQPSQWSTSGGNIYNNNSGFVGIGSSATPQTALHVFGEFTVSGSAGDVRWAPRSGSGTTMMMYNPSGTDLRVFGGGDLFTFTSTGNLGIGLTAPTAKLHVIGSPASSSAYVTWDGADYSLMSVRSQQLSAFGTHVFTSLNLGANKFASLLGLSEDLTDGTSINHAGVLGVGVSRASNSQGYIAGIEGDAYRAYVPGGTTSLLIGVSGYAEVDQGTATKTAAFYAWAPYSSAPPNGSIGLNAGVYIDNQNTFGANVTNNYQLYSASTSPFVITPNGSVGIGTTGPLYPLDVRGTLYFGNGPDELSPREIVYDDGWNASYVTYGVDAVTRYKSTGPFVWKNVPTQGTRLTATGTQTMVLDQSGNLSTSGAIHAAGAVTGSTVYATYQDVAEWVPASPDAIEPGTVVVLDPEKENGVTASSAAYDTTVAGVVSQHPGLVLGVGGEGKAQVATTGRVKVKVDATKGAIRVGDLLVTSGVAGTAMKSEPMVVNGRRIHQPGTIIGKALQPLASGTGEILVLLSLQ